MAEEDDVVSSENTPIRDAAFAEFAKRLPQPAAHDLHTELRRRNKPTGDSHP